MAPTSRKISPLIRVLENVFPPFVELKMTPADDGTYAPTMTQFDSDPHAAAKYASEELEAVLCTALHIPPYSERRPTVGLHDGWEVG